MNFIEILHDLERGLCLPKDTSLVSYDFTTSLGDHLKLNDEGRFIFKEIFDDWYRTARLLTNTGCSSVIRVRDLCILMRPMDKSGACVKFMEEFCESKNVTFPPFDSQIDMAKRLAGIPSMHWRYKWETEETRHTGVMAQTFHALFPSTTSDRVIEPVDIIGQLLNLTQVHEQQIIGMQTEMGRLRQKIDDLENKK